jgi:hypothetical protein
VARPDRTGGGGLSLRTLTIASAASLTAALVTSRLFPPGTIYASALTPVVVAAVSEMLNRPADRLSELRRQRRTMVMEAARAPYGEEGAALQGAPGFAQGAAAEEEIGTTVHGNGTGDEPPITIHGRTRRRLLHPKVWLVTGAIAFVIGLAVLTLPELIFGGAVASKHRTTYFGGGGSSSTKTKTTETKTTTTPQQTVTETVPSQTPPSTQTQTTPTDTSTTPTDTSTTPTDTSTTPTDTGTTTAPGGAAVPPTP